jgi:hypothetical protein
MPIKAREMDSIDAAIAAQLDILRHTADVNHKVLALIEAMRLDLIKQIPGTTQVNKARIKALINKSSTVIDDYYTQAREVVDDSLNVVAQISAQETVVGLPVGLVAALPTANQLKSIVSNQMIEGAPSVEWWSRQSDDTAFKFANALRQGIVQGESTSLIVDRVNSIVDLAERGSYSLVHTSVQQAANDAAMATIKNNDDIYKGYRHLSTLDSNTSDICIARSNLEWDLDHNPIGHSLPWNPAPVHWSCRSRMMGILRTFRELGFDIDEPKGLTRSSAEGQIARETSFDEFLKRRTIAEQDGQLGVGRAQLWRDGKITLKQLVDGNGNPMSLEALKAKYSK